MSRLATGYRDKRQIILDIGLLLNENKFKIPPKSFRIKINIKDVVSQLILLSVEGHGNTYFVHSH
jgi:hypothetical protein